MSINPTAPYCRPLAVPAESEKLRVGRQTVTGPFAHCVITETPMQKEPFTIAVPERR